MTKAVILCVHKLTFSFQAPAQATMFNIRARPDRCESPNFRCPCAAIIWSRVHRKWLCGYCTSHKYTPQIRCSLDGCFGPGRSVEKDTGNWYCDAHGHQCEVYVARPEGCRWPSLNLVCSQEARTMDQNRQYICDDHLEEMAAHPNRPLRLTVAHYDGSVEDAAESPTNIQEDDVVSIDLDVFSTVVERNCPICFEPKLKWRKLTSCGHELCEECLHNQILSSFRNRFLCPFDRRPFFGLPGN